MQITNQRSDSRNYLLQLAIVALFVLLEVLGLSQPIFSQGQRLLNPFLQLSTKAVYTVMRPYYLVRKSYRSAKKIQDLEARYSESLALLGELEALKAENAQLRDILQSTDRGLEKVIITTPVISLASPAIAAGAKEGVTQGDIVLSHGTFLAVVTEVAEHHSLLTLLYQKNAPAILATTESGYQGLVKGDGRHILLTELLIDAEIQIGERVISSGQAGIAKDVFIGKVRSIRSEPSDAVKTAVVEQYISFYESLVVEVQ